MIDNINVENTQEVSATDFRKSAINMVACVEAILFAFGDPLSKSAMMRTLDLSEEELNLTLEKLKEKYDSKDSGIYLRRLGDKYTLCTKSEYDEEIRVLLEPEVKQGLSSAAFEALAVVAYHQPVTRARVEKIRGVNSDSAIHTLLEKGLIEKAGKLEVPGHPTLFRTTELFLRNFGYDSIDDLPEIVIDGGDNIFDEEKFSEMNIAEEN